MCVACPSAEALAVEFEAAGTSYDSDCRENCNLFWEGEVGCTKPCRLYSACVRLVRENSISGSPLKLQRIKIMN